MEFLLTISIVFVIVILFYIYSSKGNANIPGPTGFPIVGSIFDVDLKCLHLKLFVWSKTYGDIFRMKLFSQSYVVINSSKLLRELFTKEPNATLTSARPDTFFNRYILYDTDVILTSYSKEWTRRRKLMLKLLNSYGEGLKKIEAEISNKLSRIRQDLLESNEKTFDPRDLVEDFVLSIIEILLVGRSFKRGSDFHKYIIDLDDYGNSLAKPVVDSIYYSLPFFRFLPFKPSECFRKVTKLYNRLPKFLEEHAEDTDSGIYQSMRTIVQSGKLNEEEAPWFTENVMKSIIYDIMGGAFLTTRGAMLSLIQILMASPNVQVKIQEEVDRVIGHDRSPSLNDRQKMAYCEAVILETLRFISHIPLAVPHSASEDVKIGEYVIPKNSIIVPNLWTIHHSEKEWNDPFEFIPERFLTVNGELVPADHEMRKRFLPFSHGKRYCPGETLAKSRIFLFLCTLMQDFTVLSADGEIPPMLDPWDMSTGFITRPHPYTCRFIKRNKCG